MRARHPRLPYGWWGALVALVALAAALCSARVEAAEEAPESKPDVAALSRASDAVLGITARAVDDANSNASLGRVRQGSGVVIDGDGLVLTIGYLILEADRVMLTLDDGREVPASVVAYDVATGFGLVRALAPLALAPVPLGRAAAVTTDEPLMVASGGDDGSLSIARLVSRRAFAGYWEYFIEGALFTTPPRRDHSGAALINQRGELVGIGSLFVADALGAPGAPPNPGNMFVPTDLLRPILAELRSAGRSAASRRAWLGLNCAELNGEVRVLRISADSPAEAAGLRPGDRILRIDGAEVAALEGLWKALWAGGEPEREVTLDILRGSDAQQVRVRAVDRAQAMRRARGI
jgi:serine protease Do